MTKYYLPVVHGAQPSRSLLLVEDSPSDAALAIAALDVGVGWMVTTVATLAEARTALDRDPFDAILLDLGLPDAADVQALADFVEASEPPVVVITGRNEHVWAADAMRLGAQDFVAKDTLAPESLQRALRFAVDRHAQQREAVQAGRRQQRYVAAIAEDVRAPLRTIRGLAELIRVDPAVGVAARGWAEQIIAQTAAVRAVVDGLSSEQSPPPPRTGDGRGTDAGRSARQRR